MRDGKESDKRILVLAPTVKDGDIAWELFQRWGFAVTICRDVPDLCRAIDLGAGAVLFTDESLKTRESLDVLSAAIARQPSWSDLPLILLASRAASSLVGIGARHSLQNLLVLDRPVHLPTLASALKTALRSRARQYEIRDYLQERRRMEESLKEADRRKDEFLAMLGHELRNPLAAITTGLRLLRSQSSDRRDWVRDSLERQTKQLVRLVDDLLDVSRITRGKIHLKADVVDLRAVAQSAVEATASQISERRHRLEVISPQQVVPVFGDAARLQQIVGNLLSNSAKYTPEGGRIDLVIAEEQDWAVVRIRDNGIGIPADMHGSIFELFGQVDSAMHRLQQGLGIGLSLVKMLVELHGGSVSVASEVGRGSEFIVRLPLAESRLPFKTPDAYDASDIASLDMLVVEDVRESAELLASVLRENGHAVRVAGDGNRALELAAAQQPDVVILDIGLPGISGYEVAKKLRRELGYWQTLIIAATGYGQESDRQRSREAGIDHHLVKPAEYETLAMLAREWLRTARRPFFRSPAKNGEGQGFRFGPENRTDPCNR